MNIGIIIFILLWVLFIEGLLFLIPAVTALIYNEPVGWCYLAMFGVSVIVGYLGTRKKPKKQELFAREGFVIVALSWILISVVGAVPLWLTGEIPSYINALFEVISGFTTTGATIVGDVEALSHAALMWRALTHWIGGMGVLVFMISILPLAGANNMHILKAESPGPSVEKLVPRVKNTAKILYKIYIAITVLQIICLLLAKMDLFSAITLSIATAGTGGFGILNSSVGDYTMAQQIIITVFMILFGVNFGAYFLILHKKPKQGLLMEEVRWYFIIIFVSATFIAWNIRESFSNIFESFQTAIFQVGSIITTTGFSTVDFDLWPTPSKTILVMLMFIGACAGSTGGGIKVSRILVMFKSVKKEIKCYLHPKTIKKLHMDGKSIEHEVLRSINVFIMCYIFIFVISLFIVSLNNRDLVTNFTAIAATFNNIGPGLAGVGPTCTFDDFSVLSKLVMMFDMLAGRLEIFPMLILFSPNTWRD